MFERIIVVTKKTALEELLLRHHSRDQVRFFLDRRGTPFAEYEAADAAYRASERSVRGGLPADLPQETIGRELVANFLFRPTDLVIVIGPDGLVANTAKYLAGQPILAVNPDPKRIDGVLVRFRPEEIREITARMRRGNFRTDRITLATATTNDGQTLVAANDFIVGRRDTVSSRYSLTYRGATERQSSSGVLISTGLGSSGWMRSVVTGARLVAEALGSQPGSPTSIEVPFAWDTPALLFAVREPFPSKYTGTSLVFGPVAQGESLVITSEMGDGGAIYSDGVLEDAIEWNAGTVVTIRVAATAAELVSRS